MHPVLLQLPGITVYSYGVAMAVGFGLASAYFLGALRGADVDRVLAFNLLLGIILVALAGSRCLFIALHLRVFFRYPAQIYQVWKGGMVLYGGLIAGLIFAVYYIRTRGLCFGSVADSAAPAIAFGLAVGRIGCLLNGCCYGIPISWGLVFPEGCPAAQAFPAVPLFPTQPISALNLVLIGVVLHILRKRAVLKGSLFPLLLVLYAIHRFSIEYFRGDTEPAYVNVTIFQLISLVLIAIGAVWVLWNLRRR